MQHTRQNDDRTAAEEQQATTNATMDISTPESATTGVPLSEDGVVPMETEPELAIYDSKCSWLHTHSAHPLWPRAAYFIFFSHMMCASDAFFQKVMAKIVYDVVEQT